MVSRSIGSDLPQTRVAGRLGRARALRHRVAAASAVLPLLAIVACSQPTPQPPPPQQGDVLWSTYLSTPQFEEARDVAAHPDGGVVLAGLTDGSLGGTNLGGFDIVVARLDEKGVVQWIAQSGGLASEGASGVAVGLDGSAVAVGWTNSDFAGQPLGQYDAFARKYDANGAPLWAKYIGGAGTDEAEAAAVDKDGNVFVVGWTQNSLDGPYAGGDADGFVRKYDSNGDIAWTKQIGTTALDSVRAAATASNGLLLVAGITAGVVGDANAGPAGTFDAFARIYNPDFEGQVMWTSQFGTAQEDVANAVTFDRSNHIVVAGYTRGSLTGVTSGGIDAFVRKYHANGTLLWTRQFGTAGSDVVRAVTVDLANNIVVVGTTDGDLAGLVGAQDGFVRVYSPDGDLLWTRQFGGPESGETTAEGVAVQTDGTIIVVGSATTRFDGQATPRADLYVLAFVP